MCTSGDSGVGADEGNGLSWLENEAVLSPWVMGGGGHRIWTVENAEEGNTAEDKCLSCTKGVRRVTASSIHQTEEMA